MGTCVAKVCSLRKVFGEVWKTERRKKGSIAREGEEGRRNKERESEDRRWWRGQAYINRLSSFGSFHDGEEWWCGKREEGRGKGVRERRGEKREEEKCLTAESSSSSFAFISE